VKATERRNALKDFESHFINALFASPGVWLTASLRLAVAKCARAALSCKGCDSLPPDVCLRPGTKFAGTCAKMEHIAFPAGPPPPLADVLVNLVHAVVRHQSRLDEAWFQDTLSALDGSEVFGSATPEDRETALYSVFNEIVVLAAVSHGIHIGHRCLLEPLPPLPTNAPSSAATPSMLNFKALLKRQPRKDTSVANCPHFLFQDLDQSSPEFQKISAPARKLLADIQTNNKWPIVCAAWAPEEQLLITGLMHAYYIEAKARHCLALVTTAEYSLPVESSGFDGELPWSHARANGGTWALSTVTY